MHFGTQKGQAEVCGLADGNKSGIKTVALQGILEYNPLKKFFESRINES